MEQNHPHLWSGTNDAGWSFETLTLLVAYQTRGALRLPHFAGSLWRGALGPALKETTCFAQRTSCRACERQNGCLYFNFYETTGRPGRPTPPRPFVLHTPWFHEPISCRPGDAIGFSLTLLDRTLWDRMPFLVAALERLGHRGIGKERARLKLHAVDLLDPSDGSVTGLFGNRTLLSPPDTSWFRFSGFTGSSAEMHDIHISILAPMILQRHGKPLDRGLPLPELARTLLHRRHDMVERFGTTTPQTDIALKRDETLTLQLAEEASVESDRTYWQPHSRVSKRQSRQQGQSGRQSQSGLMGEVHFARVSSHLLPLLGLGVLAHAGRGTSMGLGAFALTVNGHSLRPPYWEDAAGIMG